MLLLFFFLHHVLTGAARLRMVSILSMAISSCQWIAARRGMEEGLNSLDNLDAAGAWQLLSGVP